ncbi:MAG: V-type ATP synthase subunit D [Candidatus Theseobacter exili]|nr:V-type ATP synthase subunit D [Candidatus Theseobacter exili]
MARYGIAPTKTNLINLKRDLSFAQEGHALLEQKRDILVSELMGMVDRAEEAQRKVEEKLQEAYSAFDEAIIQNGRNKISSLSSTVSIDWDVSIRNRRVMGVSIPLIQTESRAHKPYYELSENSFWVDETVSLFSEVLSMLGDLAQLKVSVMRLSNEVQKTIRRVNALEKVYIPDYEETLQYIQEMLNEFDRQAFFIQKMIKNRLKKKKGG